MGLVSRLANDHHTKHLSKANKQVPLMISHKAIYILVNGPESHSTRFMCYWLRVVMWCSGSGHGVFVFTYLFIFSHQCSHQYDHSPLGVLLRFVFTRVNIISLLWDCVATGCDFYHLSPSHSNLWKTLRVWIPFDQIGACVGQQNTFNVT